METELKRFRRENYFQLMPFIANDLQQGDLIVEFTKFPASCIARGIVGLAWEYKKAGQRKCLLLDIDGFTGKALKLLSQPETYSYLGENARKKIINDYSIKNAVAGYLATIKEVMQKS